VTEWSFAGVRVYNDQYEDSLLLYGELINNTQTPQALAFVTGIFYDEQGQVIADEESTYDYWPPVETIPAGGRLPFELTVDGIHQAANFSLSVEAEESNQTPRQDFVFSNLDARTEEEAYCVSGILQNPGPELSDYLVIMLILYDNQEQVINFGDYYDLFPEGAISELDFEICVDPPNQGVARYDLRAWGQ